MTVTAIQTATEPTADEPVPTGAQADIIWHGFLTQVMELVAATGRFPRATRGPEELRLKSWVTRQRRTMNPERIRILDEKLPGWRGGRLRSWEDSFTATAAYFKVHGKNPTQTNPDPEVARLALWLRDQRRHATPEQQAALDSAVPGWRGKHPGHRAWSDSFKEMQAFVATHGRLPRATADRAEARLRTWLYDQRRLADDDQRAQLDSAFPGWDDPASTFDAMFAAVKEFHSAHGRLPRTSDKADAGKLGQWLSSQRQTASGERRETLDREFPGWHITLESQWEETLSACEAFLRDHGTHPRAHSAEAAEVSLGRWIQKQRRHATEVRINRLDAAIPGWRGTGRGTVKR